MEKKRKGKQRQEGHGEEEEEPRFPDSKSFFNNK